MVKDAAKKHGKAKSISGEEALKLVGGSGFRENEATVDGNDPTGMKKGDEVEIWPIDTGFNHKDRGSLVGLTDKEIVVESRTKKGTSVRIHAPRHVSLQFLGVMLPSCLSGVKCLKKSQASRSCMLRSLLK